MYIWAEIPAPYRAPDRWSSPRSCLSQAGVACRPASGSENTATTHVRFALIENEHRIRQAVRGIRDMLRRDSLGRAAA